MSIAIAVVTLLFFGSAAFTVAGVYLLTGLPWAFIALGVLLFGAGAYLRRGLKLHG